MNCQYFQDRKVTIKIDFMYGTVNIDVMLNDFTFVILRLVMLTTLINLVEEVVKNLSKCAGTALHRVT